MPCIGIDFGTTNSLIVAYDKTKGSFIYFNFSDRRGNEPMPTSSTVWFHDNITEVGKKARESISIYGDVEGHHFERSVKLKLGTNHRLNIFGSSMEPYKVAGLIISNLKKKAIEDWMAEKTGVDMSRAVFTVPINYSGQARRELRKSAHEAGIEVVTFIHEPFAAIVGYFFTKYQGEHFESIITRMRQMENRYILTFDWGGGTLDLTVVRIHNGKMEELGTSELTNVAGDKFDEDIANYAWTQFLNKHGAKYSKEHLEAVRKKKWGKMLAIAERCKLELSTREQSDFIFENITNRYEDIDVTITRKAFESMLSNSLEAACNRIDEAINQAGIQDVDISSVLLTGGSCYIPAVKERLIEKFGQRVEEVRNADLVIAQGAAVISEMKWLPFLTKDILVELSDGSYWPIFEHDMPIAYQETATNFEEFSCVDSRMKRAKIIVSEGKDQHAQKNLAILNVPLLGDQRFGDDIVVEAELDRDIILTIKGHSKMVHGYGRGENYSIRKKAEVVQMCFGLDFTGVDHGL